MFTAAFRAGHFNSERQGIVKASENGHSSRSFRALSAKLSEILILLVAVPQNGGFADFGCGEQ